MTSDQELEHLHEIQEPSFKKMDRQQQLMGFSKLQLPCSFPAAASEPPLRRTISEPIYSSPTTNNNYAPLPPLPKPSIVHQESSSSPRQLGKQPPTHELLPMIYRTVSDPSPLANATPPPPRPPLPRNHAESSSAKRLRRMKERMREMREWWDQVASDEQDGEDQDEDEDQLGGGNDHDHHGHVDKQQQQQLHQEGFKNDASDEYFHHPENNQAQEEKLEANKQEPAQEAVWVENTEGNCLVLHFKCPCGNGYQVLLSGSNCYYKLTSF